jgi:8-oxo-dGTP diphosphatase
VTAFLSAIRRREIACAILLDTFGRLLLQQHDDKTGIAHPGKISLFGGHRESNETYLQCATREICEEITYFALPECFEHLTSYTGVNPELDSVLVHAEFFIVRNLPVERLVITEGSLLTIKQDELVSVETRLTPPTRYAIRAFLTHGDARGLAIDRQ